MRVPRAKHVLVPLSLLALLFAFYLAQSHVPPKPDFQLNLSPVSECSGNVCVEVNPYTELTNVVFHLAGWNSNNATPYSREAGSYFSPYGNHRAVLLAKKALREGLGYDAIPKFAMELNSTEWSAYLVRRVHGDKKLLNELATAIKDFARDSNFSAFYESHKEFYREQIGLFLKENPDVFSLPRFEENFFREKKSRWIFVLQPLEVYYSYGGWTNNTVYAFLGVCSFSNGTYSYCSASTHELAHSFVNPAVGRHYREFKEYEEMFSPVKDVMTSMGYASWKTYLDETFVRAFEAYYILKTEGNQSAERFIKGQEALGFYLVGRVYRAYLTEYIPNKEKYPTFESFMPELAKLMGSWYKEGFWRNVSPEPTIRMAFMAFKTEGVKLYVAGNLSNSEYVKSYVETLKKAGFKVTFTKGLESGNVIVIAPLNSPAVSKLKGYMEIRGNSVVLDGVEYSKGVFLVEVLRNPKGGGYILLITGTPDVFNRKPSGNSSEDLMNYHYFVYLTSLKRAVAFG
ncbi:DUF4932 domain-containing protein [Thermococcus nautili]|uniref:DUF4932 domain-containing protein n=1 Tax=Thermococcus nautili TaxID=195522 RepID=UPI0009FE631C|nr:DUF4932 domain-containing protein [Thermococcus nautili]